MFGISFPELLVILTLAFLVIGPKKLSESMYILGTWVRKAKNQWEVIKQTKLSGLDSSALYDMQIELNKGLHELKSESRPTPPAQSPTPPSPSETKSE
jgi:sec-independent protein translocase protein TatB